MQDLMIDLETLGTNTDAPIISIGAAWFDIPSRQIGNTFYAVLDVAEQMDSRKRFADASTIKWWMSQSNAAKNVFKDGAKDSSEILTMFYNWVMTNAGAGKNSKQTRKCMPWGNGAGFDITLMESIFKSYGVECPWMFYNIMDLRTYRRFVGNGAKVEKLGTDHNALDDSISQIKYIFDCEDAKDLQPAKVE
tara:strand:- start:55303 stop:55878 length:576 start_codon:yes stop_codon:yes gene_type:complete